MVPVTTGGISASIQWVPAKCTTTPMTISRAPTTTIPPRAAAMPSEAVAARTGAMIAKLEPR
jgi:hypothetical protein